MTPDEIRFHESVFRLSHPDYDDVLARSNVWRDLDLLGASGNWTDPLFQTIWLSPEPCKTAYEIAQCRLMMMERVPTPQPEKTPMTEPTSWMRPWIKGLIVSVGVIAAAMVARAVIDGVRVGLWIWKGMP